jgi:polysaccharide pyruvyl transferase WcaK-like protein
VAAILINNTALRNNGDLALVRSLARALSRRGHRVCICSHTPAHVSAEWATLPILPEVRGYETKLFRKPVFAGLAALWLLLAHPEYRRAEILIGAPGGYLNSFYGFRWKLTIYRWAKLLGKKTAIYSQSVGPLKQPDADCLRRSAAYLDVLVVRDELSMRTALQAGFRSASLVLSEDAIFLSPPRVSARSPGSRKVLISVREWRYEGRDVSRFEKLIHGMLDILGGHHLEIEFVSTCQGIDGYVDDSRLAEQIVASYAGDCTRISVCRDRLSLEQLEQRIETARFVIGTRLHMCLLSMMGGVPALNISYEAKGIECYRYLGLESCCVDYNASPIAAGQRLQEFLAHLDALRMHTVTQVAQRHRESNSTLDSFLCRLGMEHVA